MPFVHLHAHSMFSNIVQPDALSTPDQLAVRAKSVGLQHLCITDHGSVSGVPDQIKAAKEHGLKPIIGSELYVCDDARFRPEKGSGTRKDYVHVVALAMNWDGWLELLQLLSNANSAEQFYYRPRNSFYELEATKNLVFLTACGGGILSRDDHDCILEKMKAAVGADRIYIEIQPHRDERQQQINARAVAAAKKLGLKLVATQDAHYANPGENVAHEMLLAIGSKDVWSNPDRWKYPADDLYLKSHDEMVQAFAWWVIEGKIDMADVAQAIQSTQEIADRLNVDWQTFPVSLPDMGANPTGQIARLCVDALAKLPVDQAVYQARLVYELEALEKSGFITYFLVLREIIHWSRENGIMVGPGRGSSGGSLVCYLLGITQIDPIEHGLMFERFFRPGRIDLPDIDTDFEDERRNEVLEFIRKRWGDAYTANIATYMTLGAKMAIKDVGRVFEIDHKEINRATAPLDSASAAKMSDDEVMAYETIKPFLARYPQISPFVKSLTGVVRGTGQHAAGVVISGVPLSSRSVVSSREERRVINWDLSTIEKMGLMKLDVLGLRTLSILRTAAEMVWKQRGLKVEYTKIPLTDPKALDVFQKGRTVGVFQFESSGMRGLLKGLRVDNFSVIADANALYRPGPMALLPVYTAVQTGTRPIAYDHPILEPILSKTYGILIYQEQMMQVFVDMGGFSYPEADNMRKIVGKKLGPDEFKKHEGAFVAGAAAKGVPEDVSRKVFGSMVEFAGYAFNKSHAVAYSIIAFWCAYMKAHHPYAFYAAHLSNSDDDQMMIAADEAMEFGIEIQMPDVNRSEAVKFQPLNENVIIAPIVTVKGIGEKAANLIVGARKGEIDANGLGLYDVRVEKTSRVVFDPAGVRAGEFTTEIDFMNRVYKRIVNSKVQGLLKDVGATPWHTPDPSSLVKARNEFLGPIHRDSVKVSSSDRMRFDEEIVASRLGQVYAEILALGRSSKLQGVIPVAGSKAQIMLVFDKPDWQEEKVGMMGKGDSYEFVRKLIKEATGLTAAGLYITSLHRFRNPPLGYDKMEEIMQPFLREEVELLKPPVVLAMGKGPITFFAGKGAKVPELNGKTIYWKDIPVICAMSPAAVIYGGTIDGVKAEQFCKAITALKVMFS